MFTIAESQGRPIQQGTQDWLYLRQFYITGTRAHQLLSSDKTRSTLLRNMLKAYNKPSSDTPYTSERLDKAHTDETMAVNRFIFMHDVKPKHTDDFLLSSKYRFAALSPDIVIYEGEKVDFTVEIKCLDTDNHLSVMINNEIDKTYFSQIEWEIFITGARYGIYYGFCQELERLADYKKIITMTDKRRAEIEKIYLDFEEKLVSLFNQYGINYEQPIHLHY